MKKISMFLMLFLSLWLIGCQESTDNKEEVSYFSVEKNNLFGAINSKGEIIVPFIYNELTPFNSKNVALAKDSEKSYLINYKNEVIIEETEITLVPQYDYMRGSGYQPVMPLLFQVVKDGQKWIYDQSGEHVLTLNSEDNITIIDGIANVTVGVQVYQMLLDKIDQTFLSNYESTIIDHDLVIAYHQNTLIVLNLDYEEILSLEGAEDMVIWMSDYMIILKNERSYAYQLDGQLIGDINGYEYIDKISNYIIYESNGLFGVHDHQGEEVIPANYQDISEISGYFAAMKQDHSVDYYFQDTLLFSRDDVDFSMIYEIFDQKYMLYGDIGNEEINAYYHIIDEEFNVLAGPYQYMHAYDKANYPIVRDINYNQFLIDENLVQMTDNYIELSYHERGFYFGRKIVGDVSHYDLLDEDGQLIRTFESGTHYDTSFHFFTNFMDISTINNIYYLEDDGQLTDTKDMNIKDIMDHITQSIHNPLDELNAFRILSRLFEYFLYQQDYQFEFVLYQGYAVASIDESYIIVDYQGNQIGSESFDSIASMSYYDIRDLYR